MLGRRSSLVPKSEVDMVVPLRARWKRRAREDIIDSSKPMKESVETLLKSFERLPEDAKHEAAAEILKRSAKLKLPAIDEDTLLQAADEIFIQLDKEESKHG